MNGCLSSQLSPTHHGRAGQGSKQTGKPAQDQTTAFWVEAIHSDERCIVNSNKENRRNGRTWLICGPVLEYQSPISQHAGQTGALARKVEEAGGHWVSGAVRCFHENLRCSPSATAPTATAGHGDATDRPTARQTGKQAGRHSRQASRQALRLGRARGLGVRGNQTLATSLLWSWMTSAWGSGQ